MRKDAKLAKIGDTRSLSDYLVEQERVDDRRARFDLLPLWHAIVVIQLAALTEARNLGTETCSYVGVVLLLQIFPTGLIALLKHVAPQPLMLHNGGW